MSRTRMWLILLGAVIVVLGAVLYLTTLHAYTRIEVSLTQGGYYRTTDNPLVPGYVFGYYSNQSFYVMNWGGATPVSLSPNQIFPLTEGATYRYFDLEIKVSEVHSGYFVLLVRK